MQKSFQSIGPGHRLSSSSTTGTTSASGGMISAAELRAKRLAALSGGASSVGAKAAIPVYDDNSNNADASNCNTDTKSKINVNNASNNNPKANENESRSNTTIQTNPISSQFISNFNSIMWDKNSNVTSESDQKRWFEQGIYTKLLLAHNNPHQSKPIKQQEQSPSQLQHDAWGLLQSHGGPCGILAAIQAELIHYLNIYDYLTKNDVAVNNRNPCFSKSDIEKGLAYCIANILVRSCLALPIQQKSYDNKNNNFDDRRKNGEYCIKLILPKSCHDNNQNKIPFNFDNTSISMLECVSLSYQTNYNKNGDTPEAKRMKQNNASTDTSITNSSSDVDVMNMDTDKEEEIKTSLINTVMDYILTGEKEEGEDNERPKRINYFYHSGGVMYFTMSLVATRGVDQIKSDMDAGTTHHLTAQFGHSTQELINLLLTGQATTNTFDKTMTLGGLLQCHGIQSQPNIGYLTQLEALRYCSVGDYYKSPKHPIWLIGSTSHFSVLFGSEQCLHESKSDLLLCQCRRAFKSIDGAEENGFIPVTELESVLKQLDLDLKEGVETLAASMEMDGAGIILWNSFWKKVSRLKTGAALGNVVQDDEEFARQLQAQYEQEMMNGVNDCNAAANANTGTTFPGNMNFETYNDHSFRLYHYNGMRGGELTMVTVTRTMSEEAVGADATLVDSSVGISSHYGDDLESVIRTKYPSCLFDWGDKVPPSLH